MEGSTLTSLRDFTQFINLNVVVVLIYDLQLIYNALANDL